MLHRVLLPQLGQTMEEGTIEKWHKREGDPVKKGEVLFELTTDKATLEVEAFADGVVKKLLVAEGASVPVNSLIAVLGEQDDELPDDLASLAPRRAASPKPSRTAPAASPSRAAPAAAAVTAPPAVAPVGAAPGHSTSPRARKIAREKQVVVEAVAGSGPHGRVIERDIWAYLDRLAGARYMPAALTTAYHEGVDLLEVAALTGGRRVSVDDVREAIGSGTVVPAKAAAPQLIELTPMRRTIAHRMAMSKQTVPHFYIMADIAMRGAREFVAEYSDRVGTKVTVTALLVKAVGRALKQHPRVNAYFNGDNVVLNGSCNVGVAVGVEDGLFVPVIRNADRKDLKQIAADLRTLGDLARQGRLLPEQYEGGSITLSNLGMFGVDAFVPIINPPESCIMGVGAIRDRVIAQDGGMVVAPVMSVTLSADHRAIDGVAAAQFLRTVGELLREPGQLA